MEAIKKISNSNTNIVQKPNEISDSEDEETKQNNETKKLNISDESSISEPSISKFVFSHKYFYSLLQEVGAIVSNDIEEDIPIYLVKVSNITIGLVLAAKVIKFFTDEEIIKWIRKGRKLTPLIEKQFCLYEKLSHYLMNYVEVKDIDEWKYLLNSKYAFPSSDNEGWSLIFGEIPELCHKIDEAQKSFEQIETSKIEIEAQKSYEQEETSITEMDGVKKSCKQLEISLTDIDEAQKTVKQLETPKADIDEAQISCDQSETSKTGEIVKKVKAISDKTKCLSYNPTGNIDEMAVNMIKEDEDKKEELTEIKKNTFTRSDIDQIKFIDKSNIELSNQSGNRIGSPELCKDTMSQSDSNDSSDCDDDLEDLFSAVGAELTAAENNDKKSQADFSNVENEEYLSESVIQTGKDIINQNPEMTTANHNNDKEKNESKDCLSDDDISDVSIALDYEFDIDSDSEMQEIVKDKSDENVLKLKVKRNELIKAEFGGAEAKTAETSSSYTKLTDNSEQLKSKNIQRRFTTKYLHSVLHEAGMWNTICGSGKLRVLHSNITISVVLAIKATDKFTNEEIVTWMNKCCKKKRNLHISDNRLLASYSWLANYLMNEVDVKDEEEWKILLNETFLNFEFFEERKKRTKLYPWEAMFGYVPEICHRVKIKFNHNFFLSQLLGYNAIKRIGMSHYDLVEIVKPQQLTVGLVLAAKAVNIFPDKDIVSWISKCISITSINSEKIHEILAIYKELFNYLEKEADLRDYESFKSNLFDLHFIRIYRAKTISKVIGLFGFFFYPHNRFKYYICSYDKLLSSEKLDSMEVIDPVRHESSEVCQVWNDLFAENTDQVLDNHSHDKTFDSNYFRHLLISKKVTEGWSSKLNKVEKVTVGLVIATIHEQINKKEIADWVEECHGTKPPSRQFFMYKILCDHLLGLKCNIEASYWKQLINSVEYQVPIENYDIWSNIFGNQIPDLLGVTLVGKLGFERKSSLYPTRFEYRQEVLECIQLTHVLQNSDCGSVKEKQNFLFDKEYFASLLTSCRALSDSNRILKSVTDLTIGQVMAAVIDNTLNEEDIYEWIKESEKNSCTKRTLESLNLKSQLFSYKLLASYLMSYPSENQHDSYLNSWRDFLNTQYVFSNVGNINLERFVSTEINSILLTSEWCISKKYELKTIVHEVRKSFQTKSFASIDDIMVSKEKCIPIFHIINRKKIFGIGESFLLEMLTKDKVLISKDPAQLKKSSLRNVKGLTLTVGHVVGAVALGVFKEIDIRNWIIKSMGCNGIVPFGPLKRLGHYLLCEAPSESAVDWNTLLTMKFVYWKKSDGLGLIPALFESKGRDIKIDGRSKITLFGSQGARSLYIYIETFKHKDDYIPNECKMFIRGICTKDGCRQHHICCKMNLCMSFPEGHDVNAQNDESKSTMTTKDETESNYRESTTVHVNCKHINKISKMEIRDCFSQFGKVVSCEFPETNSLYCLVEFENGNAAINAANQTEKLCIRGNVTKVELSDKAVDGDKIANEETFKIPLMCNKYNAQGKCTKKSCRYPHRCRACGGEHPAIKCRQKEEKDKFIKICHKYNYQGYCTKEPCKWPHRCSRCGEQHPIIRCKQQKEKDKDGSEKSGNNSVDEEGKNKRPRTSSKCSSNSPLNDNEFDIDAFIDDVSENSDNDSDDEERIKKKSKFESERFISSSKVPSNLSLKVDESVSDGVNEKASRIAGMCNAYNNTSICHHKQCWHPHRCDKCGGEHPRFKCLANNIKSGNEKDVSDNSNNDSDDEERNKKKSKFESERFVSSSKVPSNSSLKVDESASDGEIVKGYRIPGLCNKYNNLENCKVTPCRLKHKCDECGGKHPRRNCIKKGEDRSPRKDSRSRSPVHRMNRDESLYRQHQLPSIQTMQHQSYSVPPPPPIRHQPLPPPLQPPQALASSSYPHVSQSAYQSSYPHVSQSPYQSNYPHVSHIEHQSNFSDVSQSDYRPKTANTSDINRLVLSRVVEKVAKLTLNMDTSFIIEHIKKEIKNLGIPSKMETIGKLILEISEKHESIFSAVVEKVAKLTLNKDTFSIIEHIKKELENMGIPATMDIIGKLVLEISEKHDKMKAMEGNRSADYGHGSSSNPINEPSVSIGYGQLNWKQSSGIPSQQSTGHMYQSSGDIHQGNTWFQRSGSAEPNSSGMPSQQSSGNMGNMLGHNEGNVMMYHNQWNQGTQGPVPGMQGWSQGQGPSREQMWPQGHTSVMPQGNIQGQGLSQGGGNAGVPWVQGHSNEVSRPMNSYGYNAPSYNKKGLSRSNLPKFKKKNSSKKKKRK